MDFFSLFFDASIVAAGKFLRQRNGYTSFDYDLFSQVGRRIMQAHVDTLLIEWDKLIDATVSDETRRQFVNVQAVELGDKIAAAYHDEMVWAS